MRKAYFMFAVSAILLLAAPVLAQGLGLPPTRLDSFVAEAKGNAEAIYGDEGGLAAGEISYSQAALPPYFGFQGNHRISAGISSSGLTTGHSSYLPCATGRDEFLGAEFSQSSGQQPTADSPQAVAALIPRTSLAYVPAAVSEALSTRNASVAARVPLSQRAAGDAGWDLSALAPYDR